MMLKNNPRRESISNAIHAGFLWGLLIIFFVTACTNRSPSVSPTPTAVLSRLTPIPAVPTDEFNAAATPENLKILYTDTESNLWVWQELTGGRQIVQSGDVIDGLFSPDGSLILYVRLSNTGYSLWSVQADGSQAREWITSEQFNGMPRIEANQPDLLNAPRDLQWLSGRNILVFTTAQKESASNWRYNNDLWQVNLDTGQLNARIPAGQGGRPKFSPDGNHIALVTPSSISIINTDGSNYISQALTYAPVNMYTGADYYPLPYWAPDASYLLAIIPPINSLTIPLEQTGIWNVPVDGSAAKLIAQITTYPLLWPVISPDLSTLAYQTPIPENPSLPVTRLILRTLESTSESIYYTDQIQFLSWSPDSQHFIFTASQGGTDTILGSILDIPVSIPGQNSTDKVYWVDYSQFVFFSRTETSWELHLANTNLDNKLLASLSIINTRQPVVLNSHP